MPVLIPSKVGVPSVHSRLLPVTAPTGKNYITNTDKSSGKHKGSSSYTKGERCHILCTLSRGPIQSFNLILVFGFSF